MATPEMLNALLQQIGGLTAALQTQQAQQAAPPAPGLGAERAPSMNKRLIDGRHLKIPVFDGEPRKFDDWAFAFKRTIRSVSREAFALLAKVEMESGEIDGGLLDVDVDVDLHAYSAELYDILCQACTGEALSLVRAVEDMLGITAWNKLFRKYKPRTMARAIRLVGAVTNPPKIKDLKDVESELDKWEELIKVLKKGLWRRIVRYGKSWHRYFDNAAVNPGARVHIGRRQHYLRNGCAADPSRGVEQSRDDDRAKSNGYW